MVESTSNEVIVGARDAGRASRHGSKSSVRPDRLDAAESGEARHGSKGSVRSNVLTVTSVRESREGSKASARPGVVSSSNVLTVSTYSGSRHGSKASAQPDMRSSSSNLLTVGVPNRRQGSKNLRPDASQRHTIGNCAGPRNVRIVDPPDIDEEELHRWAFPSPKEAPAEQLPSHGSSRGYMSVQDIS